MVFGDLLWWLTVDQFVLLVREFGLSVYYDLSSSGLAVSSVSSHKTFPIRLMWGRLSIAQYCCCRLARHVVGRDEENRGWKVAETIN
jgi:hypothetical protein